MSDFCTATLSSSASTLYKRVLYTTGLVLGVDEFEQEQTFFMERDRLHQRALHGYGTVHGLGVSLTRDDASAGGPEVQVAPGMAVDPHGQHICVHEAQCARLDDWLAQQRPGDPDVPFDTGDPADRISVYVLLRYRACPTDAVPLPGEPCRSLEDTMTASRLEDDFSLSLSFTRPPQVEEAVLRVFGELLAAIDVVDTAPFTPRETLVSLVRRLEDVRTGMTLDDLLATASPPLGSPPDSPPSSPPTGGLRIPRSEATDILRTLFRVWVTEVRPSVLRTGRDDDPLDAAYTQSGAGRCSSVPEGDDAVLLAELRFSAEPVGDGLERVPDAPDDIDLIERERPLLLATRLLQEAFTALPGRNGDGDGGGGGPVALDDLTDVTISGDLTDTLLGWDGGSGQWVPTALPPPTTDHGGLSGLDDDDHTQYLRVDGNRAMTGDLDAGGNRVENVSTALGNGDAVPFEQAVKDGDVASGDLGGTYPDPDVLALQGNPVAATTPAPGQVLRWSGTEWAPVNLPASGGESPREETDLVRLVALNWPHGAAAPLDLELDGEPISGIAIAFGHNRDDTDVDLAPVLAQTVNQRTFQVFTESFDGAALGGIGAWRPVRLELGDPIGLADVTLDASGLIAEAESSQDALIVGALYPIGPDLREQIPGGRIEVVVRGDFILDETEGRAIDAEHVRGTLPSGDRPLATDVGVQGGRFESWFTVGQEAINVNTASIEDLQRLPGIGPELARRIVDRRESEGEFRTVDDVASVSGIGRSLLTDLRGRLTTE